MNNKILKIWNMITTLLVAAAVILAILLVGVRFIGIQIYTVLSGSMEPAYPTGSLIYVREIDAAELKAGDVITFKLSGDTIATHRIVEFVTNECTAGELQFRTKGDANEVVDSSLVHQDSLIGKPIFMIPYLGYIITYIQQPPGMYLTIAVGAGLLLFMILPDLLFGGKKKEE